MYYRANEVLKQIDHMRADRQKLLKDADALYQRIQSLESEFRKMVLELKPTVVAGEPRKREGGPSLAHLQDLIRKKMVDDPLLEEKLDKLLNS